MTNRIPWGPDSPGYPNCPVPAGHDCTLWWRDGLLAADKASEGWDWKHNGGDPENDIIAYCDHDAPDQARELLAEVASTWRERQSVDLLARIDAYLKGAS